MPYQDRRLFHLILTLAVLQMVFAAWPGIDIAVSDHFRFGGTGFPLALEPGLAALRGVFWNLCSVLAVLIIAAAFLPRPGRQAQPGPCPVRRAALFLILGPGLLVNGMLKSWWGRLRPDAVAELGGEGAFTPAFRVAGECTRNCSFVSGEAAFGAACALVLWNFARHGGRAGPGLGMCLLAGAVLMAALRLATGRHFLSDILFAALFMAIMAQLILVRAGDGASVSASTAPRLSTLPAFGKRLFTNLPQPDGRGLSMDLPVALATALQAVCPQAMDRIARGLHPLRGTIPRPVPLPADPAREHEFLRDLRLRT